MAFFFHTIVNKFMEKWLQRISLLQITWEKLTDSNSKMVNKLFIHDCQTKILSISVIRWNPDAIVFNSFQSYGTPSYWVQLFFSESSGATLLNSSLQTSSSSSLIASAINWQSSADKKNYIRIKVTETTSH